MSLLRLLTVGRSLGIIRDQPSRYKMTQQSLLPKFGPAKPGGPGEGERVEELSLRAAEAPPVDKVVSPAAPGATVAKPKKTMTTVETDSPATPGQAFPAGRWTIFRNPFGFAATRSKTKPEAEPVQGELLLDAVKPVRNDLSDSDLEVVRVCRTAPVTPAPVAGPPETPATAPGVVDPPVWDRVRTQFFGAGKS